MVTDRIIEGGIPYQHEGDRPLVLLPRREVERRVGMSKSTIYRGVADKTFPAPVYDIDTSATWWLEHEIAEWIQIRVDARDRRFREEVT